MIGTPAAGLRGEIDQLISEGQAEAAARLLRDFWRTEPGPSTAAFVTGRFDKLRGKVPLLSYKLAILRSFTVEPAISPLRATAYAAGIDLHVHLGDFNTYVQEIVDPESAVHGFSPDAVILAVQGRDVAPGLWQDFADLNAEQGRDAVQNVVDRYRDWIGTFRQKSKASLIVHLLEMPEPASGLLDTRVRESQKDAFAAINTEIRKIAGEFRGVYVLDYDSLVARHGRLNWQDERKWLTVRMPVAATHVGYLAKEWARFLHPLTGKVAKAVAIDLDNTLWGGVIGEDGMAGIRLGGEYPGAAYRSLQRALLDLYRRGILLAVCSKNNPEDAMEALERHPEMLLRPQHFAVLRINWQDKAQNLREIAAELNIGIDAIAFLDDNPVERQHVRAALPEVTVIELPEDPMQYARVLRESPVFERLTLSEEDRERGQYYVAQRERTQLEQSVGSKEDFYRSLQQEAEVAAVSPATLARVAQLTQKTNQFNVTTRRYTEQEISDKAASPDWGVYSIRVRDRFADNGLVGVAILHFDGGVCEIDTLLLSCRVIGRTVETAFLAWLIERAEARGAKRIAGWFLPTKKNAPAKDFYASHGFDSASEDSKGVLWALDLPQSRVMRPEWVRLIAPDGD